MSTASHSIHQACGRSFCWSSATTNPCPDRFARCWQTKHASRTPCLSHPSGYSMRPTLGHRLWFPEDQTKRCRRAIQAKRYGPSPSRGFECTSSIAYAICHARRSESKCAIASLPRLFDDHRNGEHGSPRVSGSTSRSRSPTNVGSDTVNAGRPAPRRRTRPRLQPHPRRQFLDPPPDRVLRYTRRARDRSNPTTPMRPSLRRRPQPTLTLVQLRTQPRKTLRNLRFIDHALAIRQPPPTSSHTALNHSRRLT